MSDDTVDLDEFLKPWSFRIRGREFTVPEVEWTEYLELARLQHRIEAAAASGKDGEGIEGDQWFELAPRVLGPVLAELIEARVGGPTITLLARSAYFFQLGDRTAADALLLTVGKAPTPTLEDQGSGSTSATPTGSTSSESGTETKRPASTTGTQSPKTSKPRSRATKAATPTAAEPATA